MQLTGRANSDQYRGFVRWSFINECLGIAGHNCISTGAVETLYEGVVRAARNPPMHTIAWVIILANNANLFPDDPSAENWWLYKYLRACVHFHAILEIAAFHGLSLHECARLSSEEVLALASALPKHPAGQLPEMFNGGHPYSFFQMGDDSLGVMGTAKISIWPHMTRDGFLRDAGREWDRYQAELKENGWSDHKAHALVRHLHWVRLWVVNQMSIEVIAGHKCALTASGGETPYLGASTVKDGINALKTHLELATPRPGRRRTRDL